MARLPALIDDLAAHDVRGRSTVEVAARMIREAGLIRTTKRGRGGEDVTWSDAAALLIGICASEVPRDAPDAVRRFSGLVPVTDDDPVLEAGLPSVLANVMAARTFRDAVAGLIKDAEDLLGLARSSASAHALRVRGASPDRRGLPLTIGFDFSLRLVLFLPQPGALIEARWEEAGSGPPVREFRRGFAIDRPAGMDIRTPAEAGADRAIEIAIGLRTFLRLHRLLRTPLVTS